MFKELHALIKARPLTLTVVALEGDRIRVCVIPQGLDADRKINEKVGHHKEVAKIPDSAIEALTTPLCLEGTGEELDAEMAEQLIKFSEAHGVLRGAVDRAQKEIVEAVQAIEERNRAKSKSKQTAGKDDKTAHNKGTNGSDSKGKESLETRQSDSLPLEWLAPSSSSPPQESKENQELSPEQEAQGQ
jgi:PRTRC genetic system protein E